MTDVEAAAGCFELDPSALRWDIYKVVAEAIRTARAPRMEYVRVSDDLVEVRGEGGGVILRFSSLMKPLRGSADIRGQERAALFLRGLRELVLEENKKRAEAINQQAIKNAAALDLLRQATGRHWLLENAGLVSFR